jgi:mannose-1-phosphate guanylyltransferase
MKFIILSGGSGKRLWPLSNSTRSKQFLKLIPNINGDNESMVQRIFRQLNFCGINQEDIYISTSKDQVDSIKRQIGQDAQVIVEPSQRNTFPAILLSCAYLLYEQNCSLEEEIVVLPVDPYTDSRYFELLVELGRQTSQTNFDIILMGISPTYPSEKYGYILFSENYKDSVNEVSKFVEKPNKDLATELINSNALWNGGVFSFKLGYLVNKIEEYLNISNYSELLSNYMKLSRISFDYEIVEKAKNVGVMKYDGKWKDLGTWNTLTENMKDVTIGKVISGENNMNTHIINELEIPIIVLGVENLVIVSNYDGILVSNKEASSYLKPYVEELEILRPMYEEKGWGTYKIVDFHDSKGITSITKHIFIEENNKIPYQLHKSHKKVWIIIEGTGILIHEGKQKHLSVGDTILIEKNEKHALIAVSNVSFIEIQIGNNFEENDTYLCDPTGIY